MNSIQERKIATDSASEIQIRNEERRKMLAIRRAAEKQRRKKRKRLLLAGLMIAIIVCAILVSVLPASYVSESPEIPKSKQTEKKDKSDEKQEKIDWSKLDKTEKTPYEEFDYYKAFNMERYEAYAAANPGMSVEDVVWKVNANLDMPMYEYDVIVSGYDDPFMIVNKYYKVPDNYKPLDLVDYGGDNLLLRKETGEAYLKMKEDAEEQGYYIQLVSGYRSVEYQSNLYSGYLDKDSQEVVDTYSARPGYSEHHTGMAMDIFGSNCSELRDFVNSPEYPWVRDNCYKYGFIIRYTEENKDVTGYDSEPWHLRYIGVEASTDMKNKGISSYEEYYAKYIDKG